MHKKNHFLRRLACTLLAAFTLASASPALAAEALFGNAFDVNAEIAYLVNLDTGLVLYEKNSTEQWSPASLTKIMTAILALEQIQDLDGTTIAMPGYINNLLAGTGSSVADIQPGMVLSARQLLYALLVPSGNDAAYILADYLGSGSIENFVNMMNARAVELGCTGTNFTNPHGLYDENNYTTAQDMYLLTRHAMGLDGFMEITETLTYNDLPSHFRYDDGGWVLISTNKMQMTAWPDYYRSYIHGIKTGYLPESASNFVSSATQNGENYLLVVMGADSDDRWPHFRVTAQLYDWAFENFSVSPALDPSQPITEVKVRYSRETDTLLLYPASELATLLPNDSDESTMQKRYNLPEAVGAPVKAGDVVGTVTLYLAGTEIGTVDLLAGQDVKRNLILYAVAKIGEFLGSLYFKVFLLLLALTLAGYILYIIYITRRNNKIKKIRR